METQRDFEDANREVNPGNLVAALQEVFGEDALHAAALLASKIEGSAYAEAAAVLCY